MPGRVEVAAFGMFLSSIGHAFEIRGFNLLLILTAVLFPLLCLRRAGDVEFRRATQAFFVILYWAVLGVAAYDSYQLSETTMPLATNLLVTAFGFASYHGTH